ncbi:N-acetylmuramoyl-L-alanine amidase [Nocardia sp. NPDC052112]|uniref:N-acetylmuramoyl-L-alanine amidase n=1 Tax=Nocardia sp. NPDC052112 TaxID=3155646 RepID=UPI003444A260
MKPSIISTGICGAVTAAVVVTLSGLAPVAIADPTSPDISTKLVGKTVFLDPGHQGPNHAENLARQVGNGRGGTKDCQTTGMTTVNGVPEHTINWKVADLVRAALQDLGAKVVLSRQDDSGWGGCVDERAQAANASGADVAVSIHADGAPAQDRGFHLIVPQLPIPDPKADQVQSGPGLAATKAVRDAYLEAGFPAANYAGAQDGLQTRADVAGPAMTTVPDVFLEMGNGANVEDAALLESPEGQVKHALAITTGLVGFLLGAPQQAGAVPAYTGSAADRPASAPPSDTPPVQSVPPAQSVPQAPATQQVPEGTQASAIQQPQAVPEPAAVPTSDGTVPTAPASSDPPQGYTPAPGYAPLPSSPDTQTPGLAQSPGAPQGGSPQSQGYAPSPNSPQSQGYGLSPNSPQSQGYGLSPNSPQSQGYGLSPNSPQSQGYGFAPNSPQSPGAAQTPGSPFVPGQTAPSTTGTLPALVGTIIQMMLPLATSLGMDNTVITSELINLAYTLASTLLGPTK